jgi:hypothetical protein
MAKQHRIEIVVSFLIPDDATIDDCVNYVDDAVSSMCGSYRPDNFDGEGGEGDPMFYLDSDSVKAVYLSRKEVK